MLEESWGIYVPTGRDERRLRPETLRARATRKPGHWHVRSARSLELQLCRQVLQPRPHLRQPKVDERPRCGGDTAELLTSPGTLEAPRKE